MERRWFISNEDVLRMLTLDQYEAGMVALGESEKAAATMHSRLEAAGAKEVHWAFGAGGRRVRHFSRSWDVRVIPLEVPAREAVVSLTEPCTVEGHVISELVGEPWVLSAHVEPEQPYRTHGPNSGRRMRVDAVERAHLLLADGLVGASIMVFSSELGDAAEAAKRLVSIIVPSWRDGTEERT